MGLSATCFKEGKSLGHFEIICHCPVGRICLVRTRERPCHGPQVRPRALLWRTSSHTQMGREAVTTADWTSWAPPAIQP